MESIWVSQKKKDNELLKGVSVTARQQQHSPYAPVCRMTICRRVIKPRGSKHPDTLNIWPHARPSVPFTISSGGTRQVVSCHLFCWLWSPTFETFTAPLDESGKTQSLKAPKIICLKQKAPLETCLSLQISFSVSFVCFFQESPGLDLTGKCLHRGVFF